MTQLGGQAQAGDVWGASGFGDARILDRRLRLPCLRGLPQFIIDDAQLGNLGSDPFVVWIEARDALAGRLVLDVSEPVPGQPARC